VPLRLLFFLLLMIVAVSCFLVGYEMVHRSFG
jgi:hypothetical protein